MIKRVKLSFFRAAMVLAWAAAAQGYGSSDMSMPEAATRGVVLWTDGKTPVSRLKVRVWDRDKERSIYRTSTDENGVFTVPEFGEGNYYVTVGPVKIDLDIFREHAGAAPQANGIVVVLPRVFAFSDASPMAVAAASALPVKIMPSSPPKIVSP